MPATGKNIITLRPAVGVRMIFILLYLAGIALLAIQLPFNIPDRFKPLVVSCFVIFGAFASVDVFFRRIVLHGDSMTIVAFLDFISRTIPRTEIDSVTWERGCGASIKLTSGKWIGLPNVGRNTQGLTNTIRAWLKRTEVKP